MEIAFIFKIAGIGVIVAVLNQILSRSGRDEYAMLTVLAGILAVLLILIPQVETIMDIIKTTFDF
ncbi:MAG: stage III sporulation protein AC [Oscillospiraceae bacterium]